MCSGVLLYCLQATIISVSHFDILSLLFVLKGRGLERLLVSLLRARIDEPSSLPTDTRDHTMSQSVLSCNFNRVTIACVLSPRDWQSPYARTCSKTQKIAKRFHISARCFFGSRTFMAETSIELLSARQFQRRVETRVIRPAGYQRRFHDMFLIDDGTTRTRFHLLKKAHFSSHEGTDFARNRTKLQKTSVYPLPSSEQDDDGGGVSFEHRLKQFPHTKHRVPSIHWSLVPTVTNMRPAHSIHRREFIISNLHQRAHHILGHSCICGILHTLHDCRAVCVDLSHQASLGIISVCPFAVASVYRRHVPSS